MITYLLKHFASFRHAYDGLAWAIRTQPNYRVHLIVSFCVVMAGIFFNISRQEWAILVLTISLGLVIETINTAIEAVSDAITREWKEEIKIAKDVSAAAMLTYAIGATCIAVLLFVPKML